MVPPYVFDVWFFVMVAFISYLENQFLPKGSSSPLLIEPVSSVLNLPLPPLCFFFIFGCSPKISSSQVFKINFCPRVHQAPLLTEQVSSVLNLPRSPLCFFDFWWFTMRFWCHILRINFKQKVHQAPLLIEPVSSVFNSWHSPSAFLMFDSSPNHFHLIFWRSVSAKGLIRTLCWQSQSALFSTCHLCFWFLVFHQSHFNLILWSSISAKWFIKPHWWLSQSAMFLSCHNPPLCFWFSVIHQSYFHFGIFQINVCSLNPTADWALQTPMQL